MKIKINLLMMPIALILLVLSSITPSYAQGQGTITANVDRTNLSTDETLTLTITLNAAVSNLPSPTLPSLNGFNIVGSGSSSQISIINGAMSAQMVYSYRLQPYQAGNLVIEPVSVTINGQTFTTEPITVQVTQGTGQTQAAPRIVPGIAAPAPTELAGQKFFIEAEVDNPTPFLGEQVVYTFRFYQAGTFLGQPDYQAPSFTGFWSEQQPDQAQYQVQAGGQLYQVTELRTILFPTAAEPVTIEPARLIIPGGFFHRDTTLQTESIQLDINPLPPNAPDSFSGAVGQFDLAAEVDTTDGKVNEPITLKVTLSGQGNLNTIPDPVWPEIQGWRSFESQASTNTSFENGTLTGSRVYERLFVPGVEGEATIPSIDYTYFDPASGMYQTTATEPIPVSIAPGSAEAPPPNFLGSNKTEVAQLATDIRHLKSIPSSLNLARRPLTDQPFYWLAWGVPLVALAGNFAWQWRQLYWQTHVGLARSSQARKKAKRALAQARKQDDLYLAANQILTTYLSDKLNQPVAGLTRRVLNKLLAESKLNSNLINRVEMALSESELGRFSPEASSPGHAENLLTEIDTLIGDLDKAF